MLGPFFAHNQTREVHVGQSESILRPQRADSVEKAVQALGRTGQWSPRVRKALEGMRVGE